MGQQRPVITPELIRPHYELEKALARRILSSDRAERSRVVQDCYDELYRTITWHPGLVHDEGGTQRKLRASLAMYEWRIRPRARVLEIGCSHGQLATLLAERHADARILASDVSAVKLGHTQQSAPHRNLRFISAEGTALPFPDSTFDVVLSSQVIEHFNRSDVELHFRKVWRVLRRGGTYVLDTPNRVTGPHDISRYFDPVATGFHLKEWTFADLTAQATQLGFVEVRTDLPVWGGLARRLGRSSATLSCPAAVKAALERPVGALRSRTTRDRVARWLGLNLIFAWMRKPPLQT